MKDDKDSMNSFLNSMEHLKHLEREAEKAYDQMYEVKTLPAATVAYNDCKELMYQAIGLAKKLGLEAEVTRLEKRLEHIKAVFRSQFSS